MNWQGVVYWGSVSLNLAMLVFNFGAGLLALWRGQSLLPNTVGVVLSAAGAWSIVVTRSWADAWQRRAAVDLDTATAMRDHVKAAQGAQFVVEGETRAH